MSTSNPVSSAATGMLETALLMQAQQQLVLQGLESLAAQAAEANRQDAALLELNHRLALAQAIEHSRQQAELEARQQVDRGSAGDHPTVHCLDMLETARR